jgi:hypothetical protein
VKGPDDIGLNEFARAMDGPIDMAFCSKVDHGSRLVRREQGGYQPSIADVTPHKDMPSIAF